MTEQNIALGIQGLGPAVVSSFDGSALLVAARVLF